MEELNKLEEYLENNGYNYRRRSLYDGEQIIVYKEGKRSWDAVCHSGSYGGKRGLLEVMGKSVIKADYDDDVEGYLTADDIISRLEVLQC